MPFILLIMALLCGCTKTGQARDQVCFKERCFFVEIVSKDEDMQRGLQFRSALGKEEGMLFIFADADRHGFWMKDTLIPLDIIWLDYAHRIVHIASVPPCASDPCPVFMPPKEASYVLEINQGEARDMQLMIGEAATFKIQTKM
jgi:uncharacterized membrane protein (UPF0127 family)